jgi:hypothetical protein
MPESEHAAFSMQVEDFCLEVALVLRRTLNLVAQTERNSNEEEADTTRRNREARGIEQ